MIYKGIYGTYAHNPYKLHNFKLQLSKDQQMGQSLILSSNYFKVKCMSYMQPNTVS